MLVAGSEVCAAATATVFADKTVKVSSLEKEVGLWQNSKRADAICYSSVKSQGTVRCEITLRIE